MTDVSCRAIIDLFEFAELRGMPIAEIQRGLPPSPVDGRPYSHEFLVNKGNFVSWSTLVAAMKAITHLHGDESWMRDFSDGILSRTSTHLEGLRTFASLAVEPKWLYWACQKWTAPSNFRHLDYDYEDLGANRVRLCMTARPGYEDYPAFYISGGWNLEKLPNLLGLPDARVDIQLQPPRAIYTVSLPPSRSIWARFRRAFNAVFRTPALIRELAIQDQSIAENYRSLAAAQALERQLRDAKAEAEAANSAKSAFLTNMSHELRTPLTAIIGFASQLAEPAVSDRERNRQAEIILRNAKSLLDIIGDMLDVSRIEAKTMHAELAPCDPRSIIEGVIELLAREAEKKRIELSAAGLDGLPPTIVSDAAKVRQILTNVVGNAIKFTSAGFVRLSAAYRTDERGRWLDIEVEDSGKGIRPEYHGALFRPFSQEDVSTSRNFGGTGLGLYLSRSLAALLGGDVALKSSSPDAGSCFFVRVRDLAEIAAKGGSLKSPSYLPAPSAPASPADAVKGRVSLVNKRLLIIEDHEDNQLLLRAILEHEGCRLDFAGNGREGLQKAISNPYDVILLDISLPEISGFDLVRRLRADGYQTPIIAVTAFASRDDRAKCLAAGCSDFVAKPFNGRALLEVLRRWCP